MTKRKDLQDEVVIGCLHKIRLGDVTAVGVLADRLEEIGDHRAEKVRRKFIYHTRRIAYYQNIEATDPFWTRSRWARWQAIATQRLSLRADIRRIFGFVLGLPGENYRRLEVWPWLHIHVFSDGGKKS